MNLLHKQAERFLRLADRDIKAFLALKENPQVELPSVCFHAQQAVEKCLKAVLLVKGIEPTRTHDLNQLTYLLQEKNTELPLPLELVSCLNPYAVIFRYDDTDIETISREKAAMVVRTIRDWAQDQCSHG